MKIPVLIEPLGEGKFQAKAGEPFGMAAEGATAVEAASRLETAVRERLKAGARLVVLDLASHQAPCYLLPPVGDEEQAFQMMQEAIAENRRREDEGGQ